MGARESLVQARVSAEEMKLAQGLAEQRGLSVADLVRGLIRHEATKMVVAAWNFKCGDTKLDLYAEGALRPHFKFAVQNASATGRELEVHLFLPGSESMDGPLSAAALSHYDWYRARDDYRFFLAGSGVWKISNLLDTESHAGDDRRSALLFLVFERPYPGT